MSEEEVEDEGETEEEEETEEEGEKRETEEPTVVVVEEVVPPTPIFPDLRLQTGYRLRPFFEDEERAEKIPLDEHDTSQVNKDANTVHKSKKAIFTHPVSQKKHIFGNFDHVHWSHTPFAEEEIRKRKEEAERVRLEREKAKTEEDSEEEEDEELSEEEDDEKPSPVDERIIPHVDDEEMYNETVKRLVGKFIDNNENSTLFLYGSEQSGKSYTMNSILEKVLNGIFEKHQSGFTFRLYELCDGGVRDLLRDQTDKVFVKVRKSENTEIEIPDLSAQKMSDVKNSLMILQEGYKQKLANTTVVLEIENGTEEKKSVFTIVKLLNSHYKNMEHSLQTLLTVLKDTKYNFDIDELEKEKLKKKEQVETERGENEEEEDSSEEEDSEEEEEGEEKKEEPKREKVPITYKKSFLTWLLKDRINFENGWITVYCLLNPQDWRVMYNDLKCVNFVKPEAT